MTEVPSIEALLEKLNSAPDLTRFRLYFAALLREAAGIPQDELFVVGGSAIEVYTVGRYSSGDIDIVSARGDALVVVLRKWGFKKDARIWYHGRLKIAVDLVAARYTGSVLRTELVPTPFGAVRLAALEDLFVKRLSSAVHWGIKGDIEHAKLLAREHGSRMDWAYVEKFAAEHQVLEVARQVKAAVEKESNRQR